MPKDTTADRTDQHDDLLPSTKPATNSIHSPCQILNPNPQPTSTDTKSTENSGHLRWLQHALAISRRAPLKPSNFRVGAVIVDPNSNNSNCNNGLIVDGYTGEFGGSEHAEGVCLAKLEELEELGELSADDGRGERVGEGEDEEEEKEEGGEEDDQQAEANLDLYTTMEPCWHRLSGKKSCADGIVEWGPLSERKRTRRTRRIKLNSTPNPGTKDTTTTATTTAAATSSSSPLPLFQTQAQAAPHAQADGDAEAHIPKSTPEPPNPPTTTTTTTKIKIKPTATTIVRIRRVFYGLPEPDTFVGENVGMARRKLEAGGVACVHVPGLEGQILDVAKAGH